MNDSDAHHDHLDQVEREALGWLQLLVSGDVTVGDLRALEQWRSSSPSHEKAFARTSRMWAALTPAARNVVERSGEPMLTGRAVHPRRLMTRRAVFGATAVAATAAYVVARPPVELWPSLQELAADYRTGVGERRRLTVTGGASVELNTRTSINVQATNGLIDRIELITGEAAITAGAGTKTAVEVVAGDGTARAGNGRFNIRRDGHAVGITCLDGEVHIECRGRAMSLQPRHQITYTAQELGVVRAVDPTQVSAWQDGLLIFRDTPLVEVIDEVNRYRPGRVILLNPDLGRRSVNARFQVDRIDDVLVLVRQIFDAQVRSLPGGLVLLS